LLDVLYKKAFVIILAAVAVSIAGVSLPAGAEDREEKTDEELLEELENESAGIELETVVVKGTRLPPVAEAAGFAETLQVKDEVKQLETVTEILSESVGVQVRRLGGLGSYGAASIRGSTPSPVPVYLDGVLLNAGGFASVNLGDLSLDTLDSITIYRGSTPAHLGTAGIGGALVLKTRSFDDAVTEMAMSAGSWSTLRGYALRGDRFGDLRTLVVASLVASRGDFEYLNQNGTDFNTEDDVIQARSNNDHQGYSLLAKLDGKLGDWKWVLANDFHAKDMGIAGINSMPSTNTRLETFRDAAHLRWSRPLGSRVALALEANYLFLKEDYDDSLGEIGLKQQHTISSTHALAAGALAEIEAGTDHFTTARLDARWERFSHREQVELADTEPKTRVRLSLTAQHEWKVFEEFSLQPNARVEYQRVMFGGGVLPGGLGEMAAIEDDDFLWQASMGMRWQAWPGLTFRANAGRFFRAPDLTELFGDRGAIVGNPELVPEQGINADVGAVYLASGGEVLSQLRAEIAGFGNWTDDLIVFVQNSQWTVRPENLDKTEVLGVEASLRVVLWDLLAMSGNYTYLHAVNRSEATYYQGNRLPGRPVHEAYGKVEVGRTWDLNGFRLWVDVDYAGSNYLDPANFKEDALARLLFGAGIRLERPREGLTVTVEVKNLLDSFVIEDAQGRQHPLRDFEAFPLPGRTVMATVHWRL
jgi:outer membrane cobalamin receptor